MYEKPQKLVNQVIEEMHVCADMLGAYDEGKESKYGFVPGLDEQESEKHLRERIKTIEEGIFQVMFTGVFNSGKSTLLNALMKSEVLAMGVLPETAVITKLIFNAEDEHVVIYKRDKVDDKGQPVTVIMENINDFFKEYHVDAEDTEKFLKLVDHVVIYQKRDGIAGSMVQLVDSPGTRASEADDQVALAFADKVDALVYVISAMAPLDMNDKAYISKHFVNKHKENVFFVVNKMNMLGSEQNVNDVKEYVRSNLHNVFVDKGGRFDEELYQKRVFYVNALGSLNTRLNRKTTIMPGLEILIPDDSTGVPEFEAALEEFLTSGDRDRKALSAYRTQMADMYMIAEQSAENHLINLAKGKNKIEDELKKFKERKEKMQKEIGEIEEDIESTVQNILRDAKDAYDRFVDAIDTEWDGYFSEKSGSMGIHVVKMLSAKTGSILKFWEDKSVREETLREKIEEATKEFSDGIRGFIELQSEEMNKQFSVQIKSRLEGLGNKLDRHQDNLDNMDIPVDIEQILQIIARERHVTIPVEDGDNVKLGQALAAILFGDPELIVTAAGGKKDTADFLADIIVTNVMDIAIALILFYIFGNLVGIIFFAIVKLIKAGVRKENITEKMIAETKNIILNGDIDKEGRPIPGLRKEGRITYAEKMEASVGGAMRRAGNDLTEGIRGKLSGIERQLEGCLQVLEEKDRNLESETKRVGQIKNRMKEAISRISELTDGEKLTEEEIKKLSSQR